MKKLALLFFIFSASAGFAGVIIVEGKYQSKNLFIQNGFTYNGVGFCAYEVTVNGKISTDEVNANTFEIDFSQFQLIPGTPVIVQIKHKDDCTPKVLNPDALKAKATFEVLSISVSKDAILNWTTKNETGSLPFIIEQFRWNIWIPVGEVQGTGEAGKNSYSFKVIPHSGENKFRIRQIGFGDVSKTSNSVIYSNTAAGKLTYSIDKKSTEIQFSGETLFRVFDIYGNVLKKGYGTLVDISNLKKGSYYICYDNQMGDFVKK